MVKGWKKLPILLNLEKVTRGRVVLITALQCHWILCVFGGQFTKDLASKFVCSGANTVTIFQGLKSGVIV